MAASFPWIGLCDGPEDAASGADALVLATEWPEYLTLDFAALAERMRGSVVLDARNALDPHQVVGAGLRYVALGRTAAAPLT